MTSTVSPISPASSALTSMLSNLDIAQDLLKAAGMALDAKTFHTQKPATAAVKVAGRQLVEEAAVSIRDAAHTFVGTSGMPDDNDAQMSLWRLLSLTYVLSAELERDTPTSGRDSCDNPARDLAEIAATLAKNVHERIRALSYPRAAA